MEDNSSKSQERAWLDWIEDEPQSQQEAAMSHEPALEQPTISSLPAADVTINLTLPKLHLPSFHQLSRLQRPSVPVLPYKRLILGISGLAVLMGSVGLLYSTLSGPGSGNAAKTAQSSSAVASETPTFTPVAPQDKPELATGKAGATAYDSSKGSYSYVDSLGGTALTVSQQAMPTNYGSPEAAVATIANKLKANQTIKYSGGTAYLAADSKSDSQVIVLSVKGVLVFVQSGFRHSVGDWKPYLDSLQ